jgi:hypothetical protein
MTMKTLALTAALVAVIAAPAAHAETRVPNEAVIRKLCPNPNAKCMARDNPDFYKDDDPEFYNRITKPADASKAPAFVGEWCLISSYGRDVLTGEYLPNTHSYDRATKCPADKRITLGRHSLDGLKFSIDDGVLVVEGSPKKGKR